MSKLLLLYGYNNYFNRIIKKQNTIAEYKAAVGTGNFVELNNTNFNLTDGVNARHVFNVSSTLDEKSADYLVREKADGNLERWFVLESVKIMGNQVQLTLRRDIVADFYSNISTAKAFIKKGMLQSGSPLIFNNENMTYNQIKKKELLLKDNTKIPWVIGYIARNDNEGEVLERDITIESEPPEEAVNYEDLEDEIKNLLDNDIFEANGIGIDKTVLAHTITWNTTGTTARDLVEVDVTTEKGFTSQSTAIAVNTTNNPTAANSYKGYPEFLSSDYATARDRILNCWKTYGGFGLISSIDSAYKNETQNRVSADFMKYNGLYYIKDNKLYKISIVELNNAHYTKRFNINNLTGTIGTKVNNYLTELVSGFGFNSNNVNTDKNFIRVIGLHKKYNITVTEEYYAKATTKIPAERNQLYDAPYDMIAIPWGTAENPGIDFGSYTSQKEYALSAARSIALTLTNLYCYDFQILPYCPLKAIRDTGEIDLTGLEEHKDYEFIKDLNNNPVNIIMFCKKSSGSFDIELDTTGYEELEEKIDSVEKKIASETNLIRFVSPNYGSIFDINAQKNEGIDVINVDYNYKPYQPYIHLAPIFKGLYGEEFNDPKGLILSGDFSIATSSSKWEEYQIQNKNYNLIFDRQIENLDVNNKITLEQTQTLAKINTATAAFTGLAGGALAGSSFGLIGAGVGAAVGAVGSAVTSGVGAKKDIEYLLRQQTENRDYAVDMYQYQLGNVKALPNTLNKVSAYNENNKIFPFIEIYDCTDIEKQNLRDKIKYNGMTVMVEGTISEYVVSPGDYIQAELIRLEGTYEDNHLVTEIYNELMRGVYIYA